VDKTTSMNPTAVNSIAIIIVALALAVHCIWGNHD